MPEVQHDKVDNMPHLQIKKAKALNILYVTKHIYCDKSMEHICIKKESNYFVSSMEHICIKKKATALCHFIKNKIMFFYFYTQIIYFIKVCYHLLPHRLSHFVYNLPNIFLCIFLIILYFDLISCRKM